MQVGNFQIWRLREVVLITLSHYHIAFSPPYESGCVNLFVRLKRDWAIMQRWKVTMLSALIRDSGINRNRQITACETKTMRWRPQVSFFELRRNAVQLFIRYCSMPVVKISMKTTQPINFNRSKAVRKLHRFSKNVNFEWPVFGLIRYNQYSKMYQLAEEDNRGDDWELKCKF